MNSLSACYILASLAGVFRGARFSSLLWGGMKNPCFHPVFPTPPLPVPRALYSRVSPVKTCVGGHNTAEKILGEVCG